MPQPFDYRLNVKSPFEQAMMGADRGQISRMRSMEMEQVKAAAERKKQMQQEFANFADIQNKTTDDYQRMIDKYPEFSQQIQRSMEQFDVNQKARLVQNAIPVRAALKNNAPERAVAILEEQAQAYENSGMVDMANRSRLMIQNIQANPDVALDSVTMTLMQAGGKPFRDMMEREEAQKATLQKTVPAEMQTFDYLTEGLSDKDKVSARRIKLGLDPRATESAEIKATKVFQSEVAKLSARFNLEPKVAGAVQAAKNEANQTAKLVGEKKTNTTAWNVYNNAMSNLSQAMLGATTGPIVGLIPAMTANAQIANGAVAVMAPVLKQMFRSAGEGTFTDKDQELLLNMIPKRTDLPKSRIAKIQAIDSIVRAKLGIEEDTGMQKDQEQYQTVTTQEQYNALPSGAIFIEDGKKYRKP